MRATSKTQSCLAAAVIAAAGLTWSLHAADASIVETGRQLKVACVLFLKKSTRENNNAMAEPDDCTEYLAGFVRTYGIARRAKLNAEIQGDTGDLSGSQPCVRLPSYLSFEEFARHVVRFADEHPSYEGRSAYELTRASLAAEYPCR